jgi:hypothetical protein
MLSISISGSCKAPEGGAGRQKGRLTSEGRVTSRGGMHEGVVLTKSDFVSKASSIQAFLQV